MKRKTAFIYLGLTSAMALTLSCRSTARRCIDQAGRVVEQQYCETPLVGNGGYYPYRWYYGGYGYGTGTYVSGGSFFGSSSGSGPSTSNGTSSTGTTRGGFGSTGDSHGSSSGGSGSGSGE